MATIYSLEARIKELEQKNNKFRELLTASSHALRSYQYGNVATDLAKEIADSIDKEVADGTKP